jgi:hypothetical protein
MERMPDGLIKCSQGINGNGCLKNMQEFREIKKILHINAWWCVKE